MAISAYTRTTYNNRAAPAAGPTNLNKNEAQLKAISDEFTNELIRPATTKATIADADEVGGNNSANSFKWVKWTWTVIKAFLKTYFDGLYATIAKTTPLDSSSILGSHTADGMPDIPDDVAGVTYVNNKNFTTADGWTAGNCTLSYSNGKMIVTATAGNPFISRAVTASKMVYFIFRKISGSATESRIVNTTGTQYNEQKPYSATDRKFQSFYIGSGATGELRIYPGYVNSAGGDVYEIEAIYIGTGPYSSRSYCKSGGGCHMLNNASVPVSGKYGRDFYMNGATSYLRSLDYFTMPPIFHFHCRWSGIENLSDQFIFGQGVVHQGLARASGTTTLRAFYWNGSALVSADFLDYFTATEHSIGTVINRTAGTITAYRDGVLFEVKTGLTIALNTTTEYLYYGRRSDGVYLKGSLGNIRIDSRAFTADEELRWANDPTSFDAQEKSVTATPYSLVTRNMNGGMSTRTALSDPKHATPASRPSGFLYEIVGYGGKLYFCTNATTPTWEAITSA